MITQDDIIYFVLTDRFKNPNINDADTRSLSNKRGYHGGNFKGIEEKIPYLQDLGITALWITPVYLNIGRFGDTDSYHGYWTMDFELIDPTLQEGFPTDQKEALKVLVDRLLDAGIKVILDMVVNHTGYHNEQYRNYPATAQFNGWFNQGGQGTIKAELAGLPDFNHDLADVRDYFVNNITDWIEETGIDAIRMDTVKHVENAFWYAFKTYIRGRYPNITLIGEVLSPNVNDVSFYQTLMDFDSLFDFPLQQTIVATLVKDGPMTWMARPRLSSDEASGVLDVDTEFYANANRLVTLLDNHDLSIGRIKTGILNHVGDWDRDLCMKILKACLAFLFTTRGIPQLYYGNEIGMEGGSDPDNRDAFRWDYFDTTNQRREAQEGKETFAFVKQLIKIRRSNDSLKYGYLLTLYVDQYIYAYMREYRGNLIIVVLNNGRGDMPSPLEIDLQGNSNLPTRIKDLCHSGRPLSNLLAPAQTTSFVSGNLNVQLQGKEVQIWRLEE